MSLWFGKAAVLPDRQKGRENMIFESELERLQERIAELAKEAKAIQDEHCQFHYRENATRPPNLKGRLNVWVRERKGGLEISWSHFRFVKPEGSTRSHVKSTHIPKGPGHKYRQHSLVAKARDWEVDTVLEIEDRMAEIRSEYADIRKAMTALKRAQKKALARGAGELKRGEAA